MLIGLAVLALVGVYVTRILGSLYVSDSHDGALAAMAITTINIACDAILFWGLVALLGLHR